MLKKLNRANNRRNTEGKPKRKNYGTLKVWKPTGEVVNNIFRIIWKIITSPIFLIIGAVVTLAVKIYFSISILWLWVSIPLVLMTAVIIIKLRVMLKSRLLITKRHAQCYNRFQEVVAWDKNYYADYVDTETVRTDSDIITRNILYRHIMQALIKLRLYEYTGKQESPNEKAPVYKIGLFSGRVYVHIKPVTVHVDFIMEHGKGYILLDFPLLLIKRSNEFNEEQVAWVLEEAGFIGWTVEHIDNDIKHSKLFVLTNTAVSNAYDFSGVS